MIADEFTLRVLVTDPVLTWVASGNATEEFAETIPLPAGIDIDDVMEVAQEAFYDAVGPCDGVAFTLRATHTSQGAAGAFVELAIEILPHLARMGTAVIGKAVYDAIKRVVESGEK